MENQSNEESVEMGSDITDYKVDMEIRVSQNSEHLPEKDNKRELANRSNSGNEQIVGRNLELREGQLGQSPMEAIKERAEMTLKKDILDEDDLIEMELEDGVELAVEDEKNKRERKQDWCKLDKADHCKDHDETKDGTNTGMTGQLQKDMDAENAEGEMIDDASSMSNNRKRKMGSPPGRQPEMKKQHDSSYQIDGEGNGKERVGYAEKTHKE